ncbi:MAG: hypothetical protein BWY58_00817 [Chloroflexi bacterium ADurb.Bin344]|nr:MAG: hypothetical protein BWY58_00817 [Chloroflexi bacterium ADurb.Bin344]
METMNRKQKWASFGRSLLSSLVPVIAAFIIGGIIISLLGENPFTTYWILISKSLFTVKGFAYTLHKAAPLILTGLAIAVTFQSAGGPGTRRSKPLGEDVAVWGQIAVVKPCCSCAQALRQHAHRPFQCSVIRWLASRQHLPTRCIPLHTEAQEQFLPRGGLVRRGVAVTGQVERRHGHAAAHLVPIRRCLPRRAVVGDARAGEQQGCTRAGDGFVEVLGFGAVGRGRQGQAKVVAQSAPVGIAQEGVLGQRCRELTLRQAEHGDGVEGHAARLGHVGHQQRLAVGGQWQAIRRGVHRTFEIGPERRERHGIAGYGLVGPYQAT